MPNKRLYTWSFSDCNWNAQKAFRIVECWLKFYVFEHEDSYLLVPIRAESLQTNGKSALQKQGSPMSSDMRLSLVGAFFS